MDVKSSSSDCVSSVASDARTEDKVLTEHAVFFGYEWETPLACNSTPTVQLYLSTERERCKAVELKHMHGPWFFTVLYSTENPRQPINCSIKLDSDWSDSFPLQSKPTGQTVIYIACVKEKPKIIVEEGVLGSLPKALSILQVPAEKDWNTGYSVLGSHPMLGEWNNGVSRQAHRMEPWTRSVGKYDYHIALLPLNASDPVSYKWLTRPDVAPDDPEAEMKMTLFQSMLEFEYDPLQMRNVQPDTKPGVSQLVFSEWNDIQERIIDCLPVDITRTLKVLQKESSRRQGRIYKTISNLQSNHESDTTSKLYNYNRVNSSGKVANAIDKAESAHDQASHTRSDIRINKSSSVEKKSVGLSQMTAAIDKVESAHDQTARSRSGIGITRSSSIKKISRGKVLETEINKSSSTENSVSSYASSVMTVSLQQSRATDVAQIEIDTKPTSSILGVKSMISNFEKRSQSQDSTVKPKYSKPCKPDKQDTKLKDDKSELKSKDHRQASSTNQSTGSLGKVDIDEHTSNSDTSPFIDAVSETPCASADTFLAADPAINKTTPKVESYEEYQSKWLSLSEKLEDYGPMRPPVYVPTPLVTCKVFERIPPDSDDSDDAADDNDDDVREMQKHKSGQSKVEVDSPVASKLADNMDHLIDGDDNDEGYFDKTDALSFATKKKILGPASFDVKTACDAPTGIVHESGRDFTAKSQTMERGYIEAHTQSSGIKYWGAQEDINGKLPRYTPEPATNDTGFLGTPAVDTTSLLSSVVGIPEPESDVPTASENPRQPTAEARGPGPSSEGSCLTDDDLMTMYSEAVNNDNDVTDQFTYSTTKKSAQKDQKELESEYLAEMYKENCKMGFKTRQEKFKKCLVGEETVIDLNDNSTDDEATHEEAAECLNVSVSHRSVRRTSVFWGDRPGTVPDMPSDVDIYQRTWMTENAGGEEELTVLVRRPALAINPDDFIDEFEQLPNYSEHPGELSNNPSREPQPSTSSGPVRHERSRTDRRRGPYSRQGTGEELLAAALGLPLEQKNDGARGEGSCNTGLDYMDTNRAIRGLLDEHRRNEHSENSENISGRITNVSTQSGETIGNEFREAVGQQFQYSDVGQIDSVSYQPDIASESHPLFVNSATNWASKLSKDPTVCNSANLYKDSTDKLQEKMLYRQLGLKTFSEQISDIIHDVSERPYDKSEESVIPIDSQESLQIRSLPPQPSSGPLIITLQKGMSGETRIDSQDDVYESTTDDLGRFRTNVHNAVDHLGGFAISEGSSVLDRADAGFHKDGNSDAEQEVHSVVSETHLGNGEEFAGTRLQAKCSELSISGKQIPHTISESDTGAKRGQVDKDSNSASNLKKSLQQRMVSSSSFEVEKYDKDKLDSGEEGDDDMDKDSELSPVNSRIVLDRTTAGGAPMVASRGDVHAASSNSTTSDVLQSNELQLQQIEQILEDSVKMGSQMNKGKRWRKPFHGRRETRDFTNPLIRQLWDPNFTARGGMINNQPVPGLFSSDEEHGAPAGAVVGTNDAALDPPGESHAKMKRKRGFFGKRKRSKASKGRNASLFGTDDTQVTKPQRRRKSFLAWCCGTVNDEDE